MSGMWILVIALTVSQAYLSIISAKMWVLAAALTTLRLGCGYWSSPWLYPRRASHYVTPFLLKCGYWPLPWPHCVWDVGIGHHLDCITDASSHYVTPFLLKCGYWPLPWPHYACDVHIGYHLEYNSDTSQYFAVSSKICPDHALSGMWSLYIYHTFLPVFFSLHMWILTTFGVAIVENTVGQRSKSNVIQICCLYTKMLTVYAFSNASSVNREDIPKPVPSAMSLRLVSVGGRCQVVFLKSFFLEKILSVPLVTSPKDLRLR